MKTERCRTCNHKLIGKTAIDVGYCLDCYNNMMVDEDYDDSDDNFQECDECDGHWCGKCSGLPKSKYEKQLDK